MYWCSRALARYPSISGANAPDGCPVTRTVLMKAGPWLSVPPDGYGGIENVVAALVPELRRRGIRVLLATVARSTLPAHERLTSFRGGQFEVLQRPYNQVSGVAHAHLHAVVRALRDRHDIDLVRDHVEVVGLAVLAAAALAPGTPPVLHTLHWDLRKHANFYSGLDAGPRVRVSTWCWPARSDRQPAELTAAGGAAAANPDVCY